MEIQPIQMPISLTQNPIQPIAPISVFNNAQSTSEVSAVNFKDLLTKAISDLNTSQTDANASIQNLATGGADNLHDVIISMEKAEMSLQYAIQVRNKVMDAYQSVIQMQV
jgi:flagellar hook-basal body complex protein FliE